MTKITDWISLARYFSGAATDGDEVGAMCGGEGGERVNVDKIAFALLRSEI